MKAGQSTKRLTWIRQTWTPALEYQTADGRFNIIWDPAGEKEGEPGGWYLSDNGEHVGIYRLLADARAAAEALR
jgi:hypothetical protein